MKRSVALWIVAALCGVATTLAVLAGPSWWTARGVVLPAAETNDYYVVNAGQLKNMASNACMELQAALTMGGAGAAVSNLVNSFSNGNDYAAVNLGQLKNVAQPFYDRLIEVGYCTNYPWTETTNDDLDFGAANLGQLKNVFSFDPGYDTDGDGMPDWWEVQYGFSPTSGVMGELAAWYRFDEGAGTAVSNSVSGSYTGVLLFASATNWIGGYTGTTNDHALWFDGIDDYVAVSANGCGSVITQAPFSVSAWVYQVATNIVYGTVVSDSEWYRVITNSITNDYIGGCLLRYDRSCDALRYFAGCPTNIGVCAKIGWAESSVGRWVHLVGTCNGTNMQLYVDGALRSEFLGNCNFQAELKPELWIGRGHVNPEASVWRGAIDDVRIYRKVLGADEIAALRHGLADTDDDSLANVREYILGTNPIAKDTDGDGLSDSWEVAHGTDPLVKAVDTDGDGMPDVWEVAYGLNPMSGSTNELVAWYRFDEGAGTAVSNSVSGSYTGVLLKAAATNWIGGYTGTTNDHALWFDGIDDYVAVSTNGCGSVITQAPFSVSAWVYQVATNMVYGTVVSDSEWYRVITNSITNDYIGGCLLKYDRSCDALRYFAGCPTNNGICAKIGWAESSVGRWVHLVGTCSGTNMQLYVDGALRSEFLSSCNFQAELKPELWIGRGHVNPEASVWRGAIDDVRFYRKALSGDEVAGMYDARGDLDGDGISNRDEYLAGTDPTDGQSFTTDGAIDIEFVPDNWEPGTNGTMRYLAHYDNPTAGTEIHLYVDGTDQLNFEIYDAAGQRHSIRHYPNRLIASNQIINGITNRIVASWKNLNSGKTNASMRLFVNGVDWQSTCGINENPKHTIWTWRKDYGGYKYYDGYYEADQVRIDFPAVIGSNTPIRSSALISNYSARAEIVSAKVHTYAYGMINADFSTNVMPFTLTNSPKTPASFERPQAIIQVISTLDPLRDVSEYRTLVRQYKQVSDGAELLPRWKTNDVPGNWPTAWQNNSNLIMAANEQDFDLAIGSYAHYDRIMRLNSELTTNPACVLKIGTNGVASVAPIGNVYCATSPPYYQVDHYPEMIDVADRQFVDKYISAWSNEISMYANCSYLFLNETSLSPYTSSYSVSPTYSAKGLEWFQEYCAKYYGVASTNMRFPVGPMDFGLTNTTVISGIDTKCTNLLEITTDPEHWARWWEWRRLVLANLIAKYSEAAHNINDGKNAHWKGTIYFLSCSMAWDERCGIDMQLISRIPHVEWMVMETERGGSYGDDSISLEEEALLQLRSLRGILTETNGTGYGSICRYIRHIDNNATSTPLYSVANMTQDVVYAAAPEFSSQIVVPYSAPALVDRPGWTTTWQNVSYHSDASDKWCEYRYRYLWTPINVISQEPTNSTCVLTWSAPSNACGYELEFSSSTNFSPANTNFTSLNVWTNMVVPGMINWRVRGCYPVLHIANDGTETSTNFYYGAWTTTNLPL